MEKQELLAIVQRARREGWARLYLNDSQITILPPEIGHLTSLETLLLSGNHLTPPLSEVWQLIHLQTLSLASNNLMELPPKIGKLTDLRQLFLNNNKLTMLPQEIRSLTNLEFLTLSGNQLRSLPPQIGHLTGLRKLYLFVNQLTALPPEIGRLIHLEELLLNQNELMELPPEIGQMTQLEELSLDNNRLRALPPQIGHLTNLRNLGLSRNQLTALPPQIGHLTNLRNLDLSGNQLMTLPQQIRNLTKLENLSLHDNPLPIPPEILRQATNPRDILDYYFTHLSEASRPLNEVKLLLVGEGAVGKTSLARRLTRGDFDRHESETQGIAVRRWERDINGETVHINLWDFGGQEIMHATHQFFLTERSLYLVVIDARAGERLSNLPHWLKMVSGYGKNSPIIVVVNKIDQNRLDLDQKALREKYPQITGFAETSCATGQGIDDLKARIAATIATIPHIRDLLPLSWFNIKEKLEAMQENTISYQEYEELCHEGGVTNEDDQGKLMGLLHELGSVLYFRDDPRLAEKGVLKPGWVTRAVYKIINDREVIKRHGVLHFGDLPRILDRRHYPHDSHLFILDLMGRFELLFPLPLSRDSYLLPDLLDKQAPAFKWNEAGTLSFQLDYDLLSGSVISRLIVRMHDYLEPDHWCRTGAVLVDRGCRARVRADPDGNRINIDVAGPPHLRRDVLSDIRAQLRDIQRGLPGLSVDERVPIPGRPEISVRYEHLLQLSSVGERYYRPDGLKEPVDVKLLLDGVASAEQQHVDSVTFNLIHIGDDIHVGNIVDSDSVAIGRKSRARAKRSSASQREKS